MNGRQHAGSCGLNEASKLWSMPWHARLKSLADTLGLPPEQAVAAQTIVRAPVSGVQGSWLGRARNRAMGVQLPRS